MNCPQPSAMGLYTSLCSSVLFPLHEALKRHHSRARMRELEQSQWWPAERIERHRVERLKKFLGAVASTVPYYEELFRSTGFDPAGVSSAADRKSVV